MTTMMLKKVELYLHLVLVYLRSTCTLHMDQVYGVEMCMKICLQIECCSESYDEKLLKCFPNPLMESMPAEPATCRVLTRRVQTRTRGEQVVTDCAVGYTGDPKHKTTYNSSIFDAYSKGDVCLVRYILSTERNTLDLDQKNEDGFTVLMLAANDGNREMFDMFIKEGASPSVKSDSNETLLMVAVNGCNTDITRYLLSLNDTKVDINSADQFGTTALLYSGNCNGSVIFQIILSAGGDLSDVDNVGEGALLFACSLKNIDVVRYILTHYNITEIQSISNDLKEALRRSIMLGYLEIVELLVEHGADLTIVDSNGNSMLAVACQVLSTDMVEYILSKKCVPVDSRDKIGATSLLTAAAQGSIEIMEILMENGCNTSAVDNEGMNVLHYGTLFGDLNKLKFIINKGFVNINSRRIDGATALIFATDLNRTDAFDLLVSSGADVAVVDNSKMNTLHWACKKGHVSMVRHILQLSKEGANHPSVDSREGKGKTPLFVAVMAGFIDIADLLVSYGADTHATDEDGDTILHEAIRSGHVDVVKHIITKYHLSFESRGIYGYTPILSAAEYGSMNIFKYLLSIGCDKDAIDAYNDNIFHLACSGGHISMVKYIHMMNFRNSLELRGWFGRTPVLLAAYYGHQDVLDYLIMHDCNMQAVDDEGNNALHLALMESHRELAMHLIKKNILDKHLHNQEGITPLAIADTKKYYEITKVLSF